MKAKTEAKSKKANMKTEMKVKTELTKQMDTADTMTREELLRLQHSEDRCWDIEREARVANANNGYASEEYMRLFFAEDVAKVKAAEAAKVTKVDRRTRISKALQLYYSDPLNRAKRRMEQQMYYSNPLNRAKRRMEQQMFHHSNLRTD